MAINETTKMTTTKSKEVAKNQSDVPAEPLVDKLLPLRRRKRYRKKRHAVANGANAEYDDDDGGAEKLSRTERTFYDFLDDEFENYEDDSFERLLDGFLIDDYLYMELKNYFEMYDLKSKDDLEMFGVDEVDYSESEESEDELERIEKAKWLYSRADNCRFHLPSIFVPVVLFVRRRIASVF